MFQEVLLNKLLEEIQNQIFSKSEERKQYKSIVISKLIKKAILKSDYFTLASDITPTTLMGLPCRVSEDLDYAEFRLLDFDITTIK